MKFTLKLKIPEADRKRLGITEDTVFETAFINNHLIISDIEEDELNESFIAEVADEAEDCEDKDCHGCQSYCPLLGACIDNLPRIGGVR